MFAPINIYYLIVNVWNKTDFMKMKKYNFFFNFFFFHMQKKKYNDKTANLVLFTYFFANVKENNRK